MDPISGAALIVVLTAAWFAVLYQVIRRAVSAGIRDAREVSKPGESNRKS